MADIVIAVALGLLTLVIAYLGVHVTLHPASDQSKNRYKAAFALLVMAACGLIGVQAYRNQSTQKALADQMGRIEINSKTPPTVVNNLPQASPPTVIVTGQPKEPGYLQYAGIIPMGGMQKVDVGKPLAMNYFWLNRSSEMVKNITDFRELDIIPPSEEANLRKAFAKQRKSLAREMEHSESSMAPGEVPPGFDTATSKPLTQVQVDGLTQGTMLVYLQIYVSWSDDRGIKGHIDDCWIIQTPNETPIVFKPSLILHNCKYETRVP